jgi:hypothetical protein
MGIETIPLTIGGVLSDASPSTQAHSDSAATGTGTKASRDDHKHAMPAAGGGPSQANQAAIEAETNENTYAPPDLIRHSPGVAKAWVSWEQSGAHGILSSHNVASVTDQGVGRTDILWADDFSGDEYSIVGMTEATGTLGHVAVSVVAAGVTTLTYDQSGGDFDGSNNMLAAFGDQ